MNAHQRVPTFNEKLAELAKTVSYRIARTSEERDAIYALRYRGYLLDGGIEENDSHRFSDPWDDVDNALLLGMYVEGRLASSVRFHMNKPAGSRMPAMDTFGDVIEPYLAAGKTLIDPTRFVVDPELARRGPDLPFLTLRMIAMAAEHFDVDVILGTLRVEHLIAYRHVIGLRPISEPRTYPLLARKIVCTAVDIDGMRKTAYGRHPFLQSTEAERHLIFGPRRP